MSEVEWDQKPFLMRYVTVLSKSGGLSSLSFTRQYHTFLIFFHNLRLFDAGYELKCKRVAADVDDASFTQREGPATKVFGRLLADDVITRKVHSQRRSNKTITKPFPSAENLTEI